MDKKLNLCKILKGHEGEVFWSDVFGLITFVEVQEKEFIRCKWGNIVMTLYPDGSKIKGERGTLFPSKDQRDWNKWVEEQKPKVPKTWSEIDKSILNQDVLDAIETLEFQTPIISDDISLKSALALLKIYQLIKAGYGGNVNFNDTYTDKFGIYYNPAWRKFVVDYCTNTVNHIAFHTKEQAEEFLKYPENVKLFKDYFMIS